MGTNITMVFPRFHILMLVFVLMASATPTMADVGTRHVLLVERAGLKQQLDALALDSTDKAVAQRHQLATAIVALDANIIASYDQTLARISQQQQRKSSKEKILVFVSLAFGIITFASVTAFYYLNKRLHRESGTGILPLYGQLFGDFVQTVRPVGVSIPALRKVNPIVVISVSLMAITIVIHLLTNLY